MVFGSTIWLSTILGQYGDFWKPRHFSALPQQTRENASPTHAISTIGGDKLSVPGFALWFSWFLQKRAKTRTQRTQLVLLVATSFLCPGLHFGFRGFCKNVQKREPNATNEYSSDSMDHETFAACTGLSKHRAKHSTNDRGACNRLRSM